MKVNFDYGVPKYYFSILMLNYYFGFLHFSKRKVTKISHILVLICLFVLLAPWLVWGHIFLYNPRLHLNRDIVVSALWAFRFQSSNNPQNFLYFSGKQHILHIKQPCVKYFTKAIVPLENT